ncbi:MAG: MATE family efflux transporter, partial [Acutalibacteraceae bacterium]
MQDTAKKQFYRSFFAIVVPIAVQQLITAAVGVADTLMLGYVSQTALAASSLAGQIQFLLNMIYGGLAAGITILAAQYWGKGDLPAIEKILAIGLKLSVLVGTVFFAGAVFFPEALMRIYTDDANMIASGAEYLRVVGFSY